MFDASSNYCRMLGVSPTLSNKFTTLSNRIRTIKRTRNLDQATYNFRVNPEAYVYIAYEKGSFLTVSYALCNRTLSLCCISKFSFWVLFYLKGGVLSIVVRIVSTLKKEICEFS